MKYLVVSDSHGDKEILNKLQKLYKDFDCLIHCGDSEMPADDTVILKYKTVLGNCDFDFQFPNELLIKEGSNRILITHGHLYGVNMGLFRLDMISKSVSANIVLFGHTHQLGVQKIGETLFLNPGSISFPRGKYATLKGTYAIIETTDKKIYVQYYTRNFKKIDELDFIFNKSE